MKLKFSLALCIFALLLTPTRAKTLLQETQQATASYTINADTQVEIIAHDIDVTVESTTGNRVEVQARVTFKGEENERVREFLDSFQQVVKDNIEQQDELLLINAQLDEPNKVQIGSRNVGFMLSFDDDELNIEYRIKVPGTNKLRVENAYADVRLTGTFQHANLKLNSCDLNGADIGQLKMDSKYGDAHLQSVEKAEIKLYENDTRITTLNAGSIDSRYSEVEIETAGQLQVESYEDEYQLGTTRSLAGSAKYSEFTVEKRVEKMTFSSIYEVTLELEEAGVLECRESKYTNFEIGKIDELTLHEGYEDEVECANLGIGNINGKYFKLQIDLLSGSFFGDVYEGEIAISEIGKDVSLVEFMGKYNTIKMGAPASPYQLKADLKYGKISVDEDKLTKKSYIKDGPELKVEMESPKYTRDNTRFTFNGYEMDITIK